MSSYAIHPEEINIMKTLCAQNATLYAFDKNNPPQLTIDAGETITITTQDCFGDQVTESQPLAGINWNQINPATGPVYINGAQKGDILKVTIQKITLAERGVCAVGPGFGLVDIPEMTQKFLPINHQRLQFNDEISLPLNPMIGVIGVAPEGDAISTGTPAAHGGNMDTKLIAEGAILYLPIFIPGALFALGDLHAAMGDGEIGGSGVEISGEVVVTLDLIKGHSISHPIVETADQFAFLVSRKTIDEALKEATNIAIEHLKIARNLTLEDATMLGSIAGNAEISQLVDPQLTARFTLPKTLLPSLF